MPIMSTQPVTTNTGQLFFNSSTTISKIIFISCMILCLTLFISPATALFMGLVIAQFTGHPYLQYNHKATTLLLQVSVIGLGFGMNVHSAMQAGKEGILFTIASITGTLVLGTFNGQMVKY